MSSVLRGVHHAFEERVRLHPHASAVAWWPGGPEDAVEELSYSALNACADATAQLLRAAICRSAAVSNGAQRAPIVAVLVREGPAWVVLQLAVLKAGAAFCMIDSTLPRDRMRFMLADVAPAVVVVPSASAARVRALLPSPQTAASAFLPAPGSVLSVESLVCLPLSGGAVEASAPAVQLSPAGASLAAGAVVAASPLCYIVHTSGSTGHPKGVPTTHASVLAYAQQYQALVGITGAAAETDTRANPEGGDRTQAHSMPATPSPPQIQTRLMVASAATFDPSVGDVATALSCGACLALVPWHCVMQRLRAAITATAATHIVSTPSLWSLGMDEGPRAAAPERGGEGLLEGRDEPCVPPPSLRVVALGGEAMPSDLPLRWAGATAGPDSPPLRVLSPQDKRLAYPVRPAQVSCVAKRSRHEDALFGIRE